MDKLYILFETDHWDFPLAGLGRYQSQLVYFVCNEEFEADPVTGDRLSTVEVHNRIMQVEELYDKLEDAFEQGKEQLVEQIDKQIDEIEPVMTRIYAIRKLTPLQKLKALIDKKVFEVMVGTHWSYNNYGERGGPFRMNRWFGLGSLLFDIYFSTQKKRMKEEKPQPSVGPIVGFVLYEDCVYGDRQ